MADTSSFVGVSGALLTRAATPDQRDLQVHKLMAARRAVHKARQLADMAAEARARAAVVDAAKHALGERGAPWWSDGAPDFNRHMVANTPYAPWYAALPAANAGSAAIGTAGGPSRGRSRRISRSWYAS